MQNKYWACTKFTGYYPVGTSAVVCAETAEDAATYLNDELVSVGLAGDAEAKHMIDLSGGVIGDVLILNDGNY